MIRADRDLWYAMLDSQHPDAERFTRWLFDDVLPALSDGGRYVWPGTQADFRRMMRRAVEAVLNDQREECLDSFCHCHDCKRDTIDIGHYYMVHDDVWAASGLGKCDGMLCLDCLQGRIGRWLTIEDFRPTDDDNRDFWRGCDRMLPRAWPPHSASLATGRL